MAPFFTSYSRFGSIQCRINHGTTNNFMRIFSAGAPYRKPFYPNRRDDNIGPQLPDQIKNRFVQQNGGKHRVGTADYQTPTEASTALPVEIATQVPAFAQYPRKDTFRHIICMTLQIKASKSA